jgi:hypothetical protein
MGYDRGDDGRLVPNGDAEVVRQIFALRAQGVGFSEIERRLPEVTITITQERRRRRAQLTRSGVYRVVRNRAYLGEQRIPVQGMRKAPRVIQNSHPALITEQEFQAAAAMKGRAPIRRGLSERVQLKGLVCCGLCGRSMGVLSYGKNGLRDKVTYACTRRGCGKASLAAEKLEPLVIAAVETALAANEPHCNATLADDDRYIRALETVTEAQEAMSAYRDSIELQQAIGIADFAAGLRTRREAIEVARRALRDTPRPEQATGDVRPFDANNLAAEYEAYRSSIAHRVIDRVLVYPRSAPHRLTLRWRGSEDDMPLTEAAPIRAEVADAAEVA